MRLLPLAFLVLGFSSPVHAVAQTTSAAQPMGTTAHRKVASDVDRQVLQALLLALAEDKEFPAPEDASKPIMVLHFRNPELSEPLVNAAQVSSDTGGKVLPHDAWNDLVRRNVVRRDPKTREVYYEGLPFDPKIAVGNAFPEPPPPLQGKTFQEENPDARGFVAAWLPGYSADGNTAVVRARVGPVKRLANLTAILRKQGDRWAVVWRKISVYS